MTTKVLLEAEPAMRRCPPNAAVSVMELVRSIVTEEPVAVAIAARRAASVDTATDPVAAALSSA